MEELPQAFGPDGKPLTFNKFIGYTYKRKPPVRMALNDGLFDSGDNATATIAAEDSSPPGSYGSSHANLNVAGSTPHLLATRHGKASIVTTPTSE